MATVTCLPEATLEPGWYQVCDPSTAFSEEIMDELIRVIADNKDESQVFFYVTADLLEGVICPTWFGDGVYVYQEEGQSPQCVAVDSGLIGLVRYFGMTSMDVHLPKPTKVTVHGDHLVVGTMTIFLGECNTN